MATVRTVRHSAKEGSQPSQGCGCQNSRSSNSPNWLGTEKEPHAVQYPDVRGLTCAVSMGATHDPPSASKGANCSLDSSSGLTRVLQAAACYEKRCRALLKSVNRSEDATHHRSIVKEKSSSSKEYLWSRRNCLKCSANFSIATLATQHLRYKFRQRCSCRSTTHQYPRLSQLSSRDLRVQEDDARMPVSCRKRISNVLAIAPSKKLAAASSQLKKSLSVTFLLASTTSDVRRHAAYSAHSFPADSTAAD